jgi:hypothetical protein
LNAVALKNMVLMFVTLPGSTVGTSFKLAQALKAFSRLDVKVPKSKHLVSSGRVTLPPKFAAVPVTLTV